MDGSIGLKQFRTCPEVAGVRADVDGDVAHQLDAVAVGVGLEGIPLGVEEELHGLVVVHLSGQPCLGGGESRRLPGAQVIGPVGKSGLLLLGLDGHEEGIVLKPVALGLAEGLVGRSGGRQQTLRRLAKDDGPLLVERAIIDALCGLRGGKLVLRQQTICCQQPVINEVGVACKGREALVGAVPVACGADG